MKVKLRRFSSFSRFIKNEIKNIEHVCNSDFGESITDKSYFEPSQEAVKRVKAVQGNALVNSLFDSQEDLNNPNFSIAHRKKGIDLAELSTLVSQSRSDFEDNFSNDSKKIKEKLSKQQDMAIEAEVSARLEKAKVQSSEQ